MAQGCNLPVSAEDARRLRASLREPLGRQAIWGAARALAQQDAVAFSKNVTYPLIDPSHPAHAVFVSSLLRNVGGNESMLQGYRDALPNALVIVAQQSPDICGLVRASEGAGATALERNLAHRTRGDAFAYELLGTAELIRLNRVNHTGSEAMNGGPSLRIFDDDRLDLGVRLSASHHPQEGGLEGLFRPAGTGMSHYRATFEADAFLFRGDHAIGIDFKHARDGGSYAGNMDHSRSQLEAIANGLMTKPLGLELREFHFVTNGVFDRGFVRAVESVNERVSAALGCEAPIGLHQHVQFPLT